MVALWLAPFVCRAGEEGQGEFLRANHVGVKQRGYWDEAVALPDWNCHAAGQGRCEIHPVGGRAADGIIDSLRRADVLIILFVVDVKSGRGLSVSSRVVGRDDVHGGIIRQEIHRRIARARIDKVVAAGQDRVAVFVVC